MARRSNWLLMRAIEPVSRPDAGSTQRRRRPGQKIPLEADHWRAERASRARDEGRGAEWRGGERRGGGVQRDGEALSESEARLTEVRLLFLSAGFFTQWLLPQGRIFYSIPLPPEEKIISKNE